MSTTYVINEAVSSCCGRPTAQCNCVNNLAKAPAGGTVGLPVWNFANPLDKKKLQQSQPTSTPVQVNNSDGPAGGCLGLPKWEW